MSSTGSRSFIHLEPFLNRLWKSHVPSNIKFFAWILSLNRLQTQDQLTKKGILRGQHNLVCPLCLGLEGNLINIYFLCPLAVKVWHMLSRWIFLDSLAPFVSICDHLAGFMLLIKSKVSKNLYYLF